MCDVSSVPTWTNIIESISLKQPDLKPVINSHSTHLPSTALSNHGWVCGILGKLTLLFALTLKAPESQHGPHRGIRLQKGTHCGDLKAWQQGMH